MDSHDFDRLARAFGSGQSRRRLLRTLGGGALGAITAGIGRSETSAAARKRDFGVVCSKNADCLSGACSPKNRQGRRVCGCPPPLSPCNGTCLDLSTAENCGACGVTCSGINGDPSTCASGACTCPNCDTGNNCICAPVIGGRVGCGVFYIEVESSCATDADCPDPNLPLHVPYTPVCLTNGSCALFITCADSKTPLG